MDMIEASAMTEASGLTEEQDGTSSARRRPLRSPSQDVAIRWAERLRKVTVKAPLQSLFVALVFGWRAGARRAADPAPPELATAAPTDVCNGSKAPL